MNETSIIILAVIVVVFLLFKQFSQISSRAAREHLEKGALIVDVRSEVEFAAGHLRRAINMPMDQIEAIAAQRLKDRNQVLLLHCQSGMRSSVAARKLARMGYTRAFNLGSFARAARIAGA
jgi:phage shock protein E